MEPWFIRESKRFQYELKALADAGFSAAVDESAKKSGKIVITVKYELDGKMHDLKARFPESYPYFPFEITSNTFPGGRHKNQYNGSLCILKDPHTTWRASKDTLAGILTTQIPKITQAQQEPEKAHEIEAHEAVQTSGQLEYAAPSFLFVGDWQISPHYSRGIISIGLEDKSNTNGILRGAVLKVLDDNKKTIASIDDAISNRYDSPIKGRWVRLPSAPSSADPENILNEAISHWPTLRTPTFNDGLDVIGILFPEEVEYEKYHENWAFIVRVNTQKIKFGANYPCYLARADQASTSVLQARSPKLSPLREKKILVVGLGSIGSVLAWQLARAGIGQINLLDFDTLQFGNTLRWMYGVMAIGHPKATILSQLLQYEFPFVKSLPFHHRIGDIQHPPNQHSDSKVLSQALDGVDMIVDATAERCVSHFLSDIAKERAISYLWATGTHGSWGGTIGRVVPGRTPGCWKCFQRFLYDEKFKGPNQENMSDVQPPGCFHSTFTGTGFDMDHVSLEATRLVVSTLCQGSIKGYPDFNWDVGIVNLFSEDGLPIAAEWHTYPLERHPECDCD